MEKNIKNKWLLVSCLQKSVRKGFVDLALNYADELYENEKSYLAYRLSIMSIEDIGLANVDLMDDFLSTEIKKANIEERGGKDYLMGVVESLANSSKDRSACDLVSLCFMKDSSIVGEELNNENTFKSLDAPLVKRVLAGWEILGAKKMKNPLVDNNEDNLHKFLEVNKSLINNEKILRIMEISYKIHNESHFMALGILKHLLDEEIKQKNKIGKYLAGDVFEKKYYPELINDKWLFDGLDWHTKEGKYAIYDTIRENPEVVRYIKEYLIDKDSISSVFGMLLFRKIGHQVNKRLIYQNAVNILKGAEQITFKKMLYNEKADFLVADKMMDEALPILKENIKKQFKTVNPKNFPF